MNKEKGILFGFLYMLFIALGSWLIIKVTKVLPGTLLVILAISALHFYIIPQFYKRYYTLADAEEYCTLSRFIPIYNQVMLFTPLFAKMYLITTILTILSWLAVFIKPSAISFLPDTIVMSWANGWIVISLILTVINSIVQGLGYVEIVKEIERDIKDISGINRDHAMDAIFTWIQYFLLFIPVFRAMSLAFQLGYLNKLVVFTGVTNSRLDALMQGNIIDDWEYDDFNEDDYYED